LLQYVEDLKLYIVSVTWCKNSRCKLSHRQLPTPKIRGTSNAIAGISVLPIGIVVSQFLPQKIVSKRFPYLPINGKQLCNATCF